MRNKLLYADKIFKDGSGHFGGGFNSRIQGLNFNQAGCEQNADRQQGFWRAEEMIAAGTVYFTHPFQHGSCKAVAFPYGGTWACNTCNSDHMEKHWWNIKVIKDGNAWCCVGEGFKDLQESNNYAFGDSREAAIVAYGEVMNYLSAHRLEDS